MSTSNEIGSPKIADSKVSNAPPSAESDSPPIACLLDGVAYGDRIEAWLALARRSLVSAGRSSEGVEFRYRADTDTQRALENLLELERECCPFLSLLITDADDEVILTVTGPENAAPLLDEFLGAANVT
jgi:hypothetical protein